MSDMNIAISDLRTRITFQTPTITTDAGGAQVETWANVATNPTVWAHWVNEHGQEAMQSDALKSTQRAAVTVRHRSDVLTMWRVLKDGEVWQLISVDPVQGQRRWVEMIVERVKGTV